MLTATPDVDQVFLGWTINGTLRSYTNPVQLVLSGDRTIIAGFAPRPAFQDVTASSVASEAITQLAARGIIRGYDPTTFGPNDPTQRAQMAALIARAVGWDTEDHGNPFPDRCDPLAPTNCVDSALWRNVGTLAFYGVAHGYPGGTYEPRSPVLSGQVISFVSRAMVARGIWQLQPDDPALYPNVPTASGHRQDIATYVHYAGALPDLPLRGAFTDWDQTATRAWFARVLWLALASQYNQGVIH